jgi:hypothetical protein
MRIKRWVTYLVTMVVLPAPSFDLVDQAPRRKKETCKEKRETTFLYTRLSSENRSIYDESHKNIHA